MGNNHHVGAASARATEAAPSDRPQRQRHDRVEDPPQERGSHQGIVRGKNTANVSVAGNNDIRVTSRFAASVMRLPGYTGGPQDLTAVGNFVLANNTISDVSVSTGLAPGGTFTNTSPPGTSCPTP